MAEEVISSNISRAVGREAQRNNIAAARVIADIVKTTLGPKGMDKMLVDNSGNITVTNDGVTILEEMEIDHPAAKMMVEIAKTQESEVGDGTTTVALLAGKLLENAETLLDRRIHPTLISKGYNLAMEKSLEILDEIALPLSSREIMKQIAMTAMTGKGAETDKELLASLIVSASEEVGLGGYVDREDIKIEKMKGGKVGESELISGFVFEKERANIEMPSKIVDARILLIDFPIEIKSPGNETKIEISSPEQLESFLVSEEKYIKELVDEIVNSNANVIFCQKGIDDVAQYYLAKEGIMAFRRVPKSDMEKIAKAVSGKIVSNIKDISLCLGSSEIVEETRVGENSYTYIRGCKNPKTVTLLLRGGSAHVLEEVERAVRDGLGDVITAFRHGKAVPGGGAVEIELAKRLRVFAKSVSGREQLAVEEFAHSLESIPETLAENAGLDSVDIVAQLKKVHESGVVNAGLNLLNDKIEDTFASGIIEPLKVKTQAISSATELASMILRIDDVLISKPKPVKENRFEGLD
jgi:thermosome